MVRNLVLQRRASGAIKLDSERIRRYTYDNCEYGYPQFAYVEDTFVFSRSLIICFIKK